jgi:hypothetical protein
LWIIADPPWHIDAVGGRSHHQGLGQFEPVTSRAAGFPTGVGKSISAQLRFAHFG